MKGVLQDKVVVVTGGASGIGRGIALVAAEQGAKAVVIGGRSAQPREGGVTTTELIQEMGVEAAFVSADVASAAQNEALMAAAMPFGGVDLMVCNAGIAVPGDGAQISGDDFATLVSVNLNGVLFGAQSAARQMQRLGKRGSIVAVSSIAGIRGSSRAIGYAATKAGVNNLVASLAASLGGNGIRVNAVCPGLIETAMAQSSPDMAAAFQKILARMPLGRMGLPHEVGNVVAFLGSDHASFVTGAVLAIDGGLSATL